MDLCLEANARHAQGLLHPLLMINDVLLRKDVQNLLIGGDVHGLSSVEHALDVRGGHFLVPDRHDAVGIQGANVAASDARVDRINLAASHELRLFHGALDGVHGGLDVHHNALL